MIHERGSPVSSPTSIQPESRVITMGAASEDFLSGRGKIDRWLCVDVVVEFVIILSFPWGQFGYWFSSRSSIRRWR
jgi:hypothetical protein